MVSQRGTTQCLHNSPTVERVVTLLVMLEREMLCTATCAGQSLLFQLILMSVTHNSFALYSLLKQSYIFKRSTQNFYLRYLSHLH